MGRKIKWAGKGGISQGEEVLVALVLVAMMSLALCSTAFSDGWTGNGGSKTITVNNALNGNTYTIYKLLDATTNGTAIAYTRDTLPSQVESIFEAMTITDTSVTPNRTYSAITQKSVDAAAVQTALKAYAEADIATDRIGSITCTNGKVEFTNLTDGYYVIKSDFAGTTVKVIGTSTTTAGLTVYEKNTTEPQPLKSVDDTTWSIGDEITYTVKFPGANYMGTGADAKIVTSYTVEDTLPPFLSASRFHEKQFALP